MLVIINGTESEIMTHASIRDIITARKLPDKGIIIELNGEIIHKEWWDNTSLNPGDELEIIRILGGG